MNDQIAATAQSILSDSPSYFLTMLFVQVFVVFRIFLRGGGDYTVRERFMAPLPWQFAVMVVVANVFVAKHMEDVLATAVAQYKRRIVMELKGAVVWILAAILAVAWLDKTAGGEM